MEEVDQIGKNGAILLMPDGSVRKYTTIGSYPIFYVSEDMDVLSPDSAYGEEGRGRGSIPRMSHHTRKDHATI